MGRRVQLQHRMWVERVGKGQKRISEREGAYGAHGAVFEIMII